MIHERTCIICGKHYSYCPNCERYNDMPRWMYLFDDEECKNIYLVINDYRTGAITKDEAMTMLYPYDVSKVKGNFKKYIDEIFDVEDTTFQVESDEEEVAE